MIYLAPKYIFTNKTDRHLMLITFIFLDVAFKKNIIKIWYLGFKKRFCMEYTARIFMSIQTVRGILILI